MIDERKMKAIELWTEGKGNTEIAKIVGVSRTTIWTWSNEEEVKAELNRFEREIKTHAQNRFNNRLDSMVNNAFSLALNSPSDKIRADMTQYCIDRVLGKTTTKVEVQPTGEENKVSVDILEQEFEEFENE